MVAQLVLIGALGASYAAAQSFVSDPLIDKDVPYTAIPYQVDQHTDGRGPQFGYNICNSTTEGQDSLCQTGYLNHLDDFCLWAPSKPGSAIGDTEGEEVAWCTKPGRGTRLIPNGALKGVQLVQSPGYVQIAGFIDQTKLNIADGDYGGELDSGGQDGSAARFIGGGVFCAKACDDTQPNAQHLCEHIYDRIGCAYNAPNNAQEGVFERCEGEDMTPVGVYTSNGETLTWTQPPESEGPITSIPYTPTPAASSNCVTFTSDQLYSQLATVTPAAGAGTSSTSSPTDGRGVQAIATGSPSSGNDGAGANSADTQGATTSEGNGANVFGVSFVVAVFGVFSSAFLL
ncbi:hypothetical protein VKT23_007505 [Stygiomarasmius scandens]|uniref:Macrofage activating glycoprotein n=1 Tax=Marasmiellus scandens TaxID=2682957 RepID=A0ABR1JL93_9AGAR